MNTTATAIMDIPQWSEKASISFLATKTQKTATGATIRKIVSASDLTSGPNMNLPWRKNFCKKIIKTMIKHPHSNKMNWSCNIFFKSQCNNIFFYSLLSTANKLQNECWTISTSRLHTSQIKGEKKVDHIM